MKILHIAEPFATGVLSFLVDLTERQIENNEVYIIYGQRPLTPSNLETLFNKGVKLIKLDAFKGAVGSVINVNTYIQINKLFKKLNPDVVHLHSSAAGFIGRWALPVSNAKIFYTPHGFSFLKEDGLKISKIIFKFIETISAKRGGKIVACSYGEYLEAKKLTENSTYVNNGINTNVLENYLPKTDVSLNDKITVCTSGRILYQKNPTLFNRIARELPDIDFLWIGEGDLKTELTSPNITVTGWVSRQESLNLLVKSQFFILPSRWEGLSISLLEAMYLKKLCLVSDVIGNRDVIQNNINGFICNTPQEYAQKIRTIINNKAEFDRLTNNSHKSIIDFYNTETMAEGYADIYNKEFIKTQTKN